MAEQGDGVDELIGGGLRVGATVAGQVAERTALRRAAEARTRAERDRAAAAGDRARVDIGRVPVGEEAVALAVLRTDDRLQARGGGLEAEAVEAREVAGRNQARPAVEAVRAPAAPAAARGAQAGRGRGVERDRER